MIDDTQRKKTIDEVLREERDHPALGLGYGPGHRMPIGLALSGGGIRSATFSLGVLQAFARRGKLGAFDYLSTVSGGGYIGGWLSAWIHREPFDVVQSKLAGTRSGRATRVHGAIEAATQAVGAVVGDKAVSPVNDEAPQIAWLRRYSNYLAPRPGLLTMDSLTLVTTWVRNVVLNLIVICAFLAALFTLPFVLLRGTVLGVPLVDAAGHAAAWFGALFCGLIAYNLSQQQRTRQLGGRWLISTSGVVSTVVVAAVLCAVCGSFWLFHAADKPSIAGEYLGRLMIVFLAVWSVVVAVRLWKEHTERGTHSRHPVLSAIGIGALEIGWYAIGGTVAIGGGLWVADFVVDPLLGWAGELPRKDAQFATALLSLTVGPPIVLASIWVASTLFAGVVGRNYMERSREWWSRLNAWLLAAALWWTAWTALSFFALPLLQWVRAESGDWFALIGWGWVGSLLAAVFVRQPAAASERVRIRFDRVLNAAAALFVVGFLIVIAAASNAGVFATDAAIAAEGSAPVTEPGTYSKSWAAYATVQLKAVQDVIGSAARIEGHDLFNLIELGPFHPVDVIFVALLIVLYVFGRRVDINAFSMHNLYRNRLVRCYLGASNDERDPQPFMGLADGDDVPLRDLAQQRPFHIVNATLNIAQGADLAWQERKAAAFVFTPLYCGYALATTRGASKVGSDKAVNRDIAGNSGGACNSAYRPTDAYAVEDGEEGDGEHRQGITLGAALATSGAAISPNMGHATRPLRAFALTVFNLRLGRWCSNPAHSAWKRSSPRFGLVSLLQELTGNSNEQTRYVYVSDGGHFDNLGLYELVRRRCKVIVAVDAAADDERALGDLADSIRKCRIDFGVEIAFSKIDRLVGDDNQRSNRGYAVGTIDYGDVKGTLILIKPSLVKTGAEPLDVLHYARQNAEFPQQSTADQFYGESQFESYRRLGLHIGQQCLDQVGGLLEPPALRTDSDANGTQASAVPEKNTPEAPARWSELLTEVPIRESIHYLFERLLGRRTACPYPGAPRTGKPSLATWVTSIVIRWRREFPEQQGSQIDVVVFSATISFTLLLLIALGDATAWREAGVATYEWLHWKTAPKLALRAAAEAHVWLFVRVQLDNALVLAYLTMFVAGFQAGLAPRGRDQDVPVWAQLAKLALCGLAVTTAAVDLLENFMLLASPAMPMNSPAEATVIDITRVGQLKWALLGATLVAFIACLKWIWDVFWQRWKK